MANKAPAFQFYAQDFDMGTATMNCAEVGVYIRALAWSWVNGPIPLDVTERASLLRLTPRELQKIWPKVGAKFIKTSDGFMNARLEVERQKQADYRAKQSNKGKASAASRGNHGSTTVQPSLNHGSTTVAERLQPEGNSSSSSSSSSSTPISTKSVERGESAAIAAGPSPSDLQTLWNDLTQPPIPKCLELNTKRKAGAASRLRERPLSEWMAVIGRIAASEFCQGKNDRGWVATFDFLIQPGTATKALEGAYDNRVAHIRPTGKETLGAKAIRASNEFSADLERRTAPALGPQRPQRQIAAGE